jgi:3-carboxy-cis,cis-muconate cycloisomerase
MGASPFDSALLGALFADPATMELLSDDAAVEAMVAVERALARVQGRLGVIPADAAAALDAALAVARPQAASLSPGTAAAGVAVPALLADLRPTLPPTAAVWLHWGATSQDIVDTALALRLAAFLDMMAPRLDALIAALSDHARRWARLPMAGRTRSQIAAPISFGLRVARWTQPLIGLRADLPAVRSRAARVQFGGAVGTNAAVAPHGPAIAAALAGELGLAAGPCWHADRAPVVEAGAWCARLCGALGKMAGDLVLMGRSESAEARAGAGGGSSTMPHKSNPVAAETIVALARWSAALTAPLNLSLLHAEERDGSSWALEWIALPQLLAAAGGALRHAEGLGATLAPDAARLRAALDLDGGAAMAEAARFALATAAPGVDAADFVRRALASDASLAVALDGLAPRQGGWAAALDPVLAMDAAEAAVEATLAPR